MSQVRSERYVIKFSISSEAKVCIGSANDTEQQLSRGTPSNLYILLHCVVQDYLKYKQMSVTPANTKRLVNKILGSPQLLVKVCWFHNLNMAFTFYLKDVTSLTSDTYIHSCLVRAGTAQLDNVQGTGVLRSESIVTDVWTSGAKTVNICIFF